MVQPAILKKEAMHPRLNLEEADLPHVESFLVYLEEFMIHMPPQMTKKGADPHLQKALRACRSFDEGITIKIVWSLVKTETPVVAMIDDDSRQGRCRQPSDGCSGKALGFVKQPTFLCGVRPLRFRGMGSLPLVGQARSVARRAVDVERARFLLNSMVLSIFHSLGELEDSLGEFLLEGCRQHKKLSETFGSLGEWSQVVGCFKVQKVILAIYGRFRVGKVPKRNLRPVTSCFVMFYDGNGFVFDASDTALYDYDVLMHQMIMKLLYGMCETNGLIVRVVDNSIVVVGSDKLFEWWELPL
ncbi:hypothetical protein V8G54_033533 [Vigna mungo]|uniref:Uncharacterized protein n=1 Tax=Vigna mungo TaxID=3915 RepID=A0AAQ3MP37_VIGMU